MREIYNFTVNKTELIDEVEITKDDKGNEIKTSKKVEKPVGHKYIIKKPSRQQSDDCELFRAATESDYIKKGIITAALLEKRLLNDGDVYTEQQKQRFDLLNKTFLLKKKEYDELLKIKDLDRNAAQKKEIDAKIGELSNIIDEIQDLRSISANLYNRTAEVMARNKAVLWLALHLSFEEKDGKLIPVFGDGEFEKKLSVYDQIEEREDDFEYSIIKKLLTVVNMWYLGGASTKEEFDSVVAIQEKSEA